MHLKRFLIKVEQADAEAWRVNIYFPGLQEAPLNAERYMRRLSDLSLAFPLPPAEEVQAMDNALLHYKLCATTNPRDIDKVYRHVRNRNLDEQEKDAHTFGGYLFATLLGNTAWKIIEEVAGTSDIELAVCWPISEWELSQLPWEMMCNNPNTFLASDPSRVIGITRVVPAANQPAGMALSKVTVSEPLKVLFVVGAAENDGRIRPGAESLGLLQRLQDKGQELLLNAHILLRASSKTIEDEIAQFRPSVVHFICHGEIEPPKGYLELVSDAETGKTELFGANPIYGLLTKTRRQPPPPIVVLNACYSGSAAIPATPATQESVSLAAELVELGIPIVVAMGGEIADHACRLFTWRFYAALLEGESVVGATAEGRWAGITHGGNPERNVDWAYPTLFLAENTSPEIITVQDKAWILRQKIASSYYQKMRNPRAFCDRFDILEEKYKQLLNPATEGTDVKRVLAIETKIQNAPTPLAISTKVPRYGKSRLLEELAARAVREGHIPCLVSFKEGDQCPTNSLELGLAILEAIDRTREQFKLDMSLKQKFIAPKHQLLKAIKGLKVVKEQLQSSLSVTPGLEARIRYYQELDSIKELVATQKPKIGNTTIGGALRLDLKALARDARKRYPDMPNMMVLVLIDEVHRFDAAANNLFEWLGSGGLGSSEEPVPLIFTFSNTEQGEYNGVARALKGYQKSIQESISERPVSAIGRPDHVMGFIKQNRNYVEHRQLGPFCASDDVSTKSKDQLPYLSYQQFLLHYKPPLVFSRKVPEDKIPRFFEELHKRVQGVPSRLELGEENDDVMAFIDAWKSVEYLEEADNEDIMNQGRERLGRLGGL